MASHVSYLVDNYAGHHRDRHSPLYGDRHRSRKRVIPRYSSSRWTCPAAGTMPCQLTAATISLTFLPFTPVTHPVRDACGVRCSRLLDRTRTAGTSSRRCSGRTPPSSRLSRVVLSSVGDVRCGGRDGGGIGGSGAPVQYTSTLSQHVGRRSELKKVSLMTCFAAFPTYRGMRMCSL